MRKIQLISTEDLLLLEKIKEGDRQAFNLLFEKYWEKAFTEAYKRLRNSEDAKDIVQEIFTKIWTNRHSQSIENFPAYLHVSIRNNVIKFVTKQKNTHPFFDNLENLAEKSSEADANLLWNEFLRSYEALLAKMPPKRQQIFRLRYHENQSTKEIALQMGITRKTVQNQLGKAAESLKIPLHISMFGALLCISLLTTV